MECLWIYTGTKADTKVTYFMNRVARFDCHIYQQSVAFTCPIMAIVIVQWVFR